MTKQSALILSVSLAHLGLPSRELRQAFSLKRKGCAVFLTGWFGKDAVEQGLNAIGLFEPKESFFQKLGYVLWGEDFSFWERLIEVFSGTRTHAYRAMMGGAGERQYDLIICHDYYTLPAGVCLARAQNCPLLFDAHEHAVTQNDHKVRGVGHLIWFFQKRYVHFLQKKYFPCVDHIMTVSDGIAEALAEAYAIKKPSVLRSLPFYKVVPFRKTDPKDIRLLFNGFLMPHRGIETCIEALALLPSHFTLTLRGSGEEDYLQKLRGLAEAKGVQERVLFEKPVSHDFLIQKTNECDVGLYVPYVDSHPQVAHVLPNKFFEYIAGGLALCVSCCPAMENIVREKDLGCVLSQPSPQHLTSTLLDLDIEQIDHYKQNSLRAAKDLCWEREEEKFQDIVRGVLATK